MASYPASFVLLANLCSCLIGSANHNLRFSRIRAEDRNMCFQLTEMFAFSSYMCAQMEMENLADLWRLSYKVNAS